MRILEEMFDLALSQSKSDFSRSLRVFEKDKKKMDRFKVNEQMLKKMKMVFDLDMNALHVYNTAKLIKWVLNDVKVFEENHRYFWEVAVKKIFDKETSMKKLFLGVCDQIIFTAEYCYSYYGLEEMADFLVEAKMQVDNFERQLCELYFESLLKANFNLRPLNKKERAKFLNVVMDLKISFRPEFIKKIARARGYHWIENEIMEAESLLTPLKLNFFSPAMTKPKSKNFDCVICGKNSDVVGGSVKGEDGNSASVCERCAVADFRIVNGYRSLEAAEMRRRRMFDAGYLFVEVFLEGFREFVGRDLETKEIKLAMEDAALEYENAFLPAERKVLERMVDQEKMRLIFERFWEEKMSK